MKRRMLWLVVVSVLLIGPEVRADEPELDPLLGVLVAQGVITVEQAEAVQEEYQRREADEVAAAPAVSPAASTVAEDDITKSKWYDKVTFKGDIRLRYEGFSKDGAYDDDRRDRFRIRLRPGLEAAITDRLTVGMELRNGDPDDPVSNNTSFDGAFQAKDFNLAQGYVDIEATDSVDVIAGKFAAGKRWTVSDFQWDDDVTVEGLMENFDLASGDDRFKGLGLTAYQLVLEESRNDSDAYLYGAQLRSDFRLSEHRSLALGAGFDYWDNPQALVDLTHEGRLGGNSVTNLVDENGLLVSDFEILNVFTEWKCKASKRWPLKVNLFYYQNLGADGIAEDEDTGYFGRLQVGDYKSKGQVAFRYSYYNADPDALFYVFTQSDTSRGSDVKAHRFDMRVGFVARSYFNLTWYHTKPNYSEDESLSRWQMDYIVRF